MTIELLSTVLEAGNPSMVAGIAAIGMGLALQVCEATGLLQGERRTARRGPKTHEDLSGIEDFIVVERIVRAARAAA